MTEPRQFVSRGGGKLAALLEAVAVDLTDAAAADFGCSTGGFVDVLLQNGARKVFAIDTAYGVLDYKLRMDERVVVLERQNALHLDPAEVDAFEPCDVVSMDVGWTKMEKALPATRPWLKADGHIAALIKPQYEKPRPAQKKHAPLADDEADAIVAEVLETLPSMGFEVLHALPSPVRGGGSRSGKGGNREWLAWVRMR